MFTYLPQLICIAGLLIWQLEPGKYPKVADAGRIMFIVGLVFSLWAGRGIV